MDSPRRDSAFTLNRRVVSFDGQSPHTTLLDFIRSTGLTGAKEGCAEGECGACAVLFVCPGVDGTTYRAVNSCLIPLPAVADREVLTVEALASSGGLYDAQRAMAELGGSQCGYCTPGFIIAMAAEQLRPKTGPCDPHALSGNLCRCTGYRPISDALRSLAPVSSGELHDRLKTPPSPLRAVDYAFGDANFSRPANLSDCLKIAEDPRARCVGGNTDLGIATNLRGERFPHLVSLEAIEEMRFLRESPGVVEIGAALTLSEIAERWANPPAVFHEWLQLFASPLIRNRATLDGNLATASPIGDAAPLLLALDASVLLISQRGQRLLPLSDFFRAYRQTALTPGEILHSIHIPKPFPEVIRFYKIAKRRRDDISTIAAAIAVTRDATTRIETARVALGGVAPTPLRAFATERLIQGTRLDRADLRRAEESLHVLTPIGDHRGSAAYRLAMAQSLLAKFRHEALA